MKRPGMLLGLLKFILVFVVCQLLLYFLSEKIPSTSGKIILLLIVGIILSLAWANIWESITQRKDSRGGTVKETPIEPSEKEMAEARRRDIERLGLPEDAADFQILEAKVAAIEAEREKRSMIRDRIKIWTSDDTMSIIERLQIKKELDPALESDFDMLNEMNKEEVEKYRINLIRIRKFFRNLEEPKSLLIGGI